MSSPGQVRPIAIPMQPPSNFVHVPPGWGHVKFWQAHFPESSMMGYPPPPGNFPGSFPVGLGMGIFSVEDVPKPPPYPPPESPTKVIESCEPSAALGVLRTPGGTPVPPRPAVSFEDAVLLPERAQIGLGDQGFGVHKAPSLDRVEEPSRLVMSLPALDVAPGSQDASVAAGDWVARVKPLLITLSPTAYKWWEETQARAYEFYQQWLTGQPSARLAVRAKVEAFRVDWGKLALVNERGAILILGALTPELQTECVTTRMLTAVGLLFTILVKYQPGGPSEKAAVLAFLSAPDTPQGLVAAQSSLRRWLRLYNRTVELGLSKPDPTLLLRGLDRLGQQASKQSQASFRLSAYRFEQRLDYEPTDASVLAYAQVLLGEVEQQLLAETPEKKPRVAKAEANAEASGDTAPKSPNVPNKGSPGDQKGKGKKGKGADGTSAPSSPSSPQDLTKALCKGYLTAKGCAYGDNCRMYHDFASAGRQSLCYSCGSLDNRYRRQDCPTVTSPKGSPKGKGKGKGKPKAAAVSANAGDTSAAPVSPGGATENAQSTPATVARAAVDPVVSSSAASASTTEQLEQEAIRVLKRLACLRCIEETPSVEAGGSPSGFNAESASSASVGVVSFPDVKCQRLMGCLDLRVVRGQNHCEVEGKGAPSGPCSEEECEMCLLRHGDGVWVDKVEPKGPCQDGVVPDDGPHVQGDRVSPEVPCSRKKMCEDSSSGSDQGRVCKVVGSCDVSVSEGLLDSGASTIFRWANVEEYARAVEAQVNLPLGTLTMKINLAGSLVTLDTRCSVLPLGLMVQALKVQVWWCDSDVQVWHPLKGYLQVRTHEGRLILGADDTRFMVQELEAYGSMGFEGVCGIASSLNVLEGGQGDEDINVSLRYVEPTGPLLGLIDGGATNSLRKGSPEELAKGRSISVELATGRATLKMSEGGTLLTERDVAPIVPLGKAISELRCSLQWDEEGCVFSHPTKGTLPIELRNGCPMVPKEVALELISELESAAYRRQLRMKALSLLRDKQWSTCTLQELLQKAGGDPEAEAVALMMYAKSIFPQVPDELLESLVPSRVQVSSEEKTFEYTGLNRRVRRRVAKSKRVLVHLFSGVQSWKGANGDVVLEIEQDKGRDVLNESLFIYLIELILQGKVKGIIGGPPCTTFSRTRARSPGPRIIRGRGGSERFGLQWLSSQENAQLQRDNVLILRMLFLVHLAQEVSHNSCFVAIEHPRDPQLLAGNAQTTELPSMWCWPELQALNLFRAEVDQGRLGHADVKPTTVATNSWVLYESLHGLVVAPQDRWINGSSESEDLRARIQATKRAAEWAPGLSRAIQDAWNKWVSEESSGIDLGVRRLKELSKALRLEGRDSSSLDKVCASLEARASQRVSRLTPEEVALKKHVECNHTPWRRDCRTCVYTAAHRSPCRRKKHPHMYTLCLDLAGPFKQGSDYTGAAKYAVVGVYTYPQFWKQGQPVGGPNSSTHGSGGEVDPNDPTDGPPVAPPEGGQELGEEMDLLEPPIPESLSAAAVPEDHPIPDDFTFEDHDASVDPECEIPLDPKELDYTKTSELIWKSITKANMETLPALHFPMVIPIFHKGKSSVLRAIQQMYVLLKKHDFPLFRIHTDRGREFVNKELRSYLLARDVYHTSTPADLPQANGLVERFIGILKSQARSVLYQSGMGENHWPSALRHVASQRFETSLSSLGAKPRKFLPFGSKVVVQARSWNHKTWLPRGMDAQVLCPADGVSKGWLVLVKGKSGAPSFMITTLCYSNLKQPHLPDIQQSRTEPAAELPHVKSKADGSKVDLPEVCSDPPLPPPAIAPIDPESPVPVTKRRLTGKTGLRTAQGGVHEGFKVNVEGLNVSSLDPPPESAAESSRPFEGQRSGEFVGDGVVEGGVSGESWDRVSRECRIYFAEKHRVSRQGVPLLRI